MSGFVEVLDTDRWRELPGYPGYYINRDGEVYSRKSGRNLKPQESRAGTYFLQLSRPGLGSEGRMIHHLMVEAFYGIRVDPRFTRVIHIDGDKSNNELDNLEYTPRKPMPEDQEPAASSRSNQVWRPLVEFPKYEIDEAGSIRNRSRIATLKRGYNVQGFAVVSLYGDDSNTRYVRQVARLVADTFDAARPEEAIFSRERSEWTVHGETLAVWHRDGDFANCEIDNLCWRPRGEVIEWNRMHRTGTAQYKTPPVHNRETGVVYLNAYDCAMREGLLESWVVRHIEQWAMAMGEDYARYNYVRI